MPVLVLLLASPAAAHHRFRHHPECRTARCAWHADQAYARHHRPKIVASRFDLCVANKETGEPGSLNLAYINPQETTGIYMGAFQWEQSKWEAGGGLRYASSPLGASWLEQVAVFRRNGARGEWTYGNWPTIAGCEQYE